jgi:rubrerythrin
MFDFLAGEEAKHYKIVDNLVGRFGGQTKKMEEETAAESGIFTEAKGGAVSEKSDNLDALNVGIQAEHKSIETYTSIHDKTDSNELKKVMKKLIQEEEKHLSILETEVEFITETGEWHDFRTVSM